MVVYFYVGDDLSKFLEWVVSFGGKVVMVKISIGEYGYIVLLWDSEGNIVGLYFMN